MRVMLRHPADAADDVVDGELPVGHLGRARHHRRERAEDRHEARDDDRLAAVLLVELVGLDQVLAAGRRSEFGRL